MKGDAVCNRMIQQKRIDAALDSVLRASGSALKNYTLQRNLDRMRAAMKQIMSDSYIAGSNAAHEALVEFQNR